MAKAKKLDLRSKNNTEKDESTNSLLKFHKVNNLPDGVVANKTILDKSSSIVNNLRKKLTFNKLFNKTYSKQDLNNNLKVLTSVIESKEKNLRVKREIKTLFSIFFRILLGFSLTLSIVILALVYYIVVPAQRIVNSYNDLKTNGSSLLNDIQNKDLTKVDTYIQNIQNDLTSINNEINRYEFLSKLEITKGYYGNFQKSRNVLQKVEVLASTSLPKLKSLLETSGFKSANNQPTLNTKDDKALSLILKEFPKYLLLYDEIKPQLLNIFADIKSLDINYVPNLGSTKLKDSLIKFNNFTDEFPSISDKAEAFLKNLPPLIGVNNDAKYLLVLQTEAEMRGSGGIFSEFGFATMHNGEFAGDISLTDMWKLHDYLAYTIHVYPQYNNIYGQLRLMEAGCGGTWARPQDVAQYPDLYYDLNVFKDYYDTAHKYNPADFPDYNYVMVIDNSFANNLLKIVEPIQLDNGTIVTSANFFDLIKGESDNVSKYKGANTSDRKAIIKDVANAVKKKFLTLSITDIPKVINTIIGSFQAKDVSLYTKDQYTQKFFDDYGFTARTIKNYTGDYFQLNEAQNCSLKLNRWVRDNVNTDILIQPNGSISENIHIHWIQPQIYNPSLIHQYEPTYNHSYRAWIRLFLPDGTTSIKSDGYKESGYLYYNPITYHDSVMDKQTSDNIVQFDHRRFTNKDPIDKKDLYVSYNLPNSINYKKDGKYSLILQKHPGKSWGEPYHINIHDNNQTYSLDLILDRDKIVIYKDGVISVDNFDKKLDWIPDLVSQIDWAGLGSKNKK